MQGNLLFSNTRLCLVCVANISNFCNVTFSKKNNSNNPGKPSAEFLMKHRRGKSETLRLQYINTKDVRFGSVRNYKFLALPVAVCFSICYSPVTALGIGFICSFSVVNMISFVQSKYRYLECCWKTSR